MDGRSVGAFVLDTGASGLVVTPAAAKELNLDAFGQLWVAGVGGNVLCQYRRGGDLKLGPVTIHR